MAEVWCGWIRSHFALRVIPGEKTDLRGKKKKKKTQKNQRKPHSVLEIRISKF